MLDFAVPLPQISHFRLFYEYRSYLVCNPTFLLLSFPFSLCYFIYSHCCFSICMFYLAVWLHFNKRTYLLTSSLSVVVRAVRTLYRRQIYSWVCRRVCGRNQRLSVRAVPQTTRPISRYVWSSIATPSCFWPVELTVTSSLTSSW